MRKKTTPVQVHEEEKDDEEEKEKSESFYGNEEH